MPASAVLRAKRAFAVLLLVVARRYDIALGINRDSDDKALEEAFRKAIRKAHPDKGGCTQTVQELQAARDAWHACAERDRRSGRPPGPGPQRGQLRATTPAEGSRKKLYELSCAAVLFTYNAVEDLAQCRRFLDAVRGHMGEWRVNHWRATLETCKSGVFHAHLMLQFTTKLWHVSLESFVFEKLRPNVAQTGADYCGEGFSGRNYQRSVDRGMFYVWAPK